MLHDYWLGTASPANKVPRSEEERRHLRLQVGVLDVNP